MKIEIRFLNENFLHDIKNSAMNTIGKKNFEDSNMSPELFYKYLISEHSPIRTAIMEVVFLEISYPSSVHFARHVHSTPFVTTSRPDRTGEKRDLSRKVDHMAIFNLQALIDMMRKRLCKGKVEAETYGFALTLKKQLINHKNEYMRIIGKVLVPNCIYRCGCPEFKSCGNHLITLGRLDGTDLLSISKRYDTYTASLYNNDIW